jgi:hypothetical protein
MARGWESKSVEEQIRSARERSGEHASPRLNAAQMDIERRRDSVMLQRTRVLNQIETCLDDRYRKTLETGLAFLDGQLSDLGKEAAVGRKKAEQA